MKILRIFIAFCILLSASVVAFAIDADVTVEVTDVEQNKILVSGTAPNDTFVTILILNPGYTAENVDFDALTSDKAAIQYFGFAKSGGGKFSKEIEINTESGGNFTVCTVAGGIKTEKTFQFYCYEAKSDFVEVLKGAPTAEELPEIISTYSLSSHPLYKADEVSRIAALVPKMNNERKLENPSDAAEFLLEVLLVNAYNTGNENAFSGGKIAYADVLGLEGEKWYFEYGTCLSENGYNAVKNGLLGGEYEGLEDIKGKFFALMCYSAIMNNASYGGDHVEYFVTEFESEYKKAGFNVDAFKKSDKKKAVFLQLVGSDAKTLSALADKFNELFKEKGNQKLPQSSAPAGGGGGGGSTKPVPTPTPTPAPSESPEIKLPFKDISGVLWAEEAIFALYEKGIIAGRSEVEFAPFQNVTRAEFVKLIVESLNIEGEGEGFADVSGDDWFAPYIKRGAGAEIINGSDGHFYPSNSITREDAAVIIARAIGAEQSGTPAFGDSESISTYAKGAVCALSEKGIINGVGDNMFAPKECLTRAQAAVLIYNMLGGEAQ